MTSNKNQQVLNLQVTDGLTVAVIKNSNHEFLMSTNDVAKGYGVAGNTIRSAQGRHIEEFIEGKHFVKGVAFCDSINGRSVQPNAILWTKAGVIRLGFFISSERAKWFRDWAEQVVLEAMKAPKMAELPPISGRNHNRLTHQRMTSILADICLIEDKELRIRILNKLMPETNLFTNPSND